jgi:bacteriorhodopsin
MRLCKFINKYLKISAQHGEAQHLLERLQHFLMTRDATVIFFSIWLHVEQNVSKPATEQTVHQYILFLLFSVPFITGMVRLYE